VTKFYFNVTFITKILYYYVFRLIPISQLMITCQNIEIYQT